jgi:YesN/AraC family two-component response regulator
MLNERDELTPLPGFTGPIVNNTSTLKSASLLGERVIICEDEGISQMQLKRALSISGLEVVGTARNGRDGVELALKERPSLILMDIRMPVMDGLEASRLILKHYQPCIVMLTAFSDSEYRRQAFEIGTAGYVVKPVTGETLLPQLEAAWRTHHPE